MVPQSTVYYSADFVTSRKIIVVFFWLSAFDQIFHL